MVLNKAKIKFMSTYTWKLEYINTISNLKVKFNERYIERLKELKYSGLVIDHKLNWSNYIYSLNRKILPILFAIYRIKKIY